MHGFCKSADYLLEAVMESKKLVTRVTAKSFVKIACLIVPDLPVATTGMLVTLNGQTVASYPGKIRNFPGRNIKG